MWGFRLNVIILAFVWQNQKKANMALLGSSIWLLEMVSLPAPGYPYVITCGFDEFYVSGRLSGAGRRVRK